MNKMLIAIVLLGVGVGLIIWGYNISQSVSGQLSEAISGSPGDKPMIMYIVGGVCAALGIYFFIKK